MPTDPLDVLKSTGNGSESNFRFGGRFPEKFSGARNSVTLRVGRFKFDTDTLYQRLNLSLERPGCGDHRFEILGGGKVLETARDTGMKLADVGDLLGEHLLVE